MKKEDVEVGGTYLAKVGTRSVEVRIERENAKGGWEAKSVATGKPIRLKNPIHLRRAKAADEGTTSPAEGDGGDTDVAPRTRTGKPKAAKAARQKAPAKPKPMSCLDAAAAVLKAKGEPMNCKAMVEAMAEQKLWTTDAPTPVATLSSAILRELKKGAASRFKKVDRGHFEYQEPKGG
jgi:hypothetical protein